MYISGSINEMNKVLTVAKDLRADCIHFISPNIVFILSEMKDHYLYCKTAIEIGESVLIPKEHYENMHTYLRAAKKGMRKQDSPFYEEVISSVVFKPSSIVFNDAPRLTVEVDTLFFRLKKEVAFKIKESLVTSYHSESPYLRLDFNELKTIHSEMKRYKNQYTRKAAASSDNVLKVEEGQLILYFVYKGQEVRIETGVTLFAQNDLFFETPYYFSDRSIYMMLWIAQTTPIEDVIFLPRSTYCLMEGYGGGMVAKVHSALKNNQDFKRL